MPPAHLPQCMMGSWPPCKRKPGGMQATTARTCVNTLQAIVGKANALTTATSLTGCVLRNQSSAGTEPEMNSCLKRGNNAHALALALSDPLCVKNGCKQLDQPLSNLHQCPVPHGLSCTAWSIAHCSRLNKLRTRMHESASLSI